MPVRAARPRRARRADLRARPTSTRSRACAWRARPRVAGGTAPCVLNAANEVAVHAFLGGRLRLHRHPGGDRARRSSSVGASRVHAFESLYEADAEARAVAGRAGRRARRARELAPRLPRLRRADHPARARATSPPPRPSACASSASRCSSRRCSRRSGAARPSTAIGAIPLGGYVKITGMNPRGGDPAGGRAPRLLPPAGVEADRRDRRRARRSTSLLAFADPVGAAPGQRHADGDAARSTRSRRDAPAAARCCKPGDRIVAVDGVRGDPRRRCASRSPATAAPARRPTAARAATPVALVVAARRRSSTRPTSRRVYDAQAQAHRCSASRSAARAQPVGPVARRRR